MIESIGSGSVLCRGRCGIEGLIEPPKNRKSRLGGEFLVGFYLALAAVHDVLVGDMSRAGYVGGSPKIERLAGKGSPGRLDQRQSKNAERLVFSRSIPASQSETRSRLIAAAVARC